MPREYRHLYCSDGGGHLSHPHAAPHHLPEKDSLSVSAQLPAIFYSTGSLLSAVIGTAIAVILAYRNLPLIVVALAASASALVTDFLCSII